MGRPWQKPRQILGVALRGRGQGHGSGSSVSGRRSAVALAGGRCLAARGHRSCSGVPGLATPLSTHAHMPECRHLHAMGWLATPRLDASVVPPILVVRMKMARLAWSTR